jgi:hypothetical protein
VEVSIKGTRKIDGVAQSSSRFPFSTEFMSQVQHLAHITVQPDWQAVIQDVSDKKVHEETFWISCYCKCTFAVTLISFLLKFRLIRCYASGIDQESVHGKARVSTGKGPQKDCTVVGESGVDIQLCNDVSLFDYSG